MQQTELIENQYSVNLPTRFYYRGKYYHGYINVVNVFRMTMVQGIAGSGKSFAVINNFIRQFIERGFTMFIYDFKFSDLSTIAYNHLRRHHSAYRVPPQFCVINFDDSKLSNRCNPVHPDYLTDISDAYEASYVVMLNLNRSWVEKSGDFFVESPIVLLASIIWFLKLYDNGRYCTFPHAIELLNKPYEKVFAVLALYSELENYLSPFRDAMLAGAQEQLQGQIASAKIPLSRLISPALYWVMSGDDSTLDLNNPEKPKILCLGNNPDRQNIYSSALGLYTSRIIKLINKKGKLPCGFVVDELPTMYLRGLDVLIATARSNKVAPVLGIQDQSQLTRDYGEKEAKVIMNMVGNMFAGQVLGESAKSLSERFGRIVQERESINYSREDKSLNVNTQLDNLIPPEVISNLSQGEFVGAVADNVGEKMKQKIFHCEILVDTEKLKEESRTDVPIPQMSNFEDVDENDCMEQAIRENYRQIKDDAERIIRLELIRISKDPKLAHLLNNEEQ